MTTPTFASRPFAHRFAATLLPCVAILATPALAAPQPSWFIGGAEIHTSAVESLALASSEQRSISAGADFSSATSLGDADAVLPDGRHASLAMQWAEGGIAIDAHLHAEPLTSWHGGAAAATTFTLYIELLAPAAFQVAFDADAAGMDPLYTYWDGTFSLRGNSPLIDWTVGTGHEPHLGQAMSLPAGSYELQGDVEAQAINMGAVMLDYRFSLMPVPEAASWGLWLAGLAVIIALRRRLAVAA